MTGRAGSTSAHVLEWGCSACPFPGEKRSGDRAVVNAYGSRALVMAVDGVGHGRDAARASDCVAAIVGESAEWDLVDLVERCHSALSDTRGAALSVASLDAGSGMLTWLGVGSVEGRLVRASHTRRGQASLPLAPGVVGHVLPPLRTARLPLARGDLLLFATDGVDPAFADTLVVPGSCSAIAGRALRKHGREGDDALVLVVRYLGLDS
jgi:negative regulator of sigma-B (phosphoserine phosphatase)